MYKQMMNVIGVSVLTALKVCAILFSFFCVINEAQGTSVTLTPTADAFVDSGNSSAKYGSDVALTAGIDGSGSIYYTFLKFDVASIPTHSLVTSASLTLTRSYSLVSGGTMQLRQCPSSWSESSITYLNKPSVSTSDTLLGSAGVSDSSSTWTLSSASNAGFLAAIQTMVDVDSNLYGWYLQCSSASRGAWMFYSRDSSYSPWKPSLTVNYTAPSISRSLSSITKTITVGSTASSSAFTISNAGTGSMLIYSLSDDVNWMSVSPSSGSSTGSANSHTISFNTSGLSAGTYTGTVTISGESGTSSKTIDVTVTVSYPPLTVSFDSQGGSSISAISVTYGATYGTLATPSRTGYTFGGWYTGANGTGNQVTSSTTVTATSNHTLYAKWIANEYVLSVTVNPSGSGTVSGSGWYTYNQMASLQATANAGWRFDRWDFNGSSTYSNPLQWQVISGASLTAYFAANTYTVSFDSQGGSIVNSISVTYSSAYGTLPTPIRSGYTFSGWWTGANGAGSQVTSFEIVSIAANHTLYAKWTQNSPTTYTVTFKNYDGSPLSTATVNSGATFGSIASKPTPTRTGYTWNNVWYKTDGTASPWSDTDTVTGNVEAWAAGWTASSARVSASHSAPSYTAGQTLIISGSFDHDGTLQELYWSPVLPSGWTLQSVSGDGIPEIQFGEVVFTGGNLPNPVQFEMTVNVPSGTTGEKQITAVAGYRLSDMVNSETISASPNPLVVTGKTCHSADYTSPQWVITAPEISRVLGYWRSGGYHVDSQGLDGYASSVGIQSGSPHSADYTSPQWVITAPEISRVLGYWRSGGYHVDPQGIDGYAPGLVQTAATVIHSLSSVVTPLSSTTINVSHEIGSVSSNGKTGQVIVTVTYSGVLEELYCTPILSDGCSLVSVSGSGGPELQFGGIVWPSSLPASPFSFEYKFTVDSVASLSGIPIQTIVGYRFTGEINASEINAAPNPLTIDMTVTSSWQNQRDTAWTGGTITTAAQLAQLAYLVNNGTDFTNQTVTLGTNINLAGKQWTPIGKVQIDAERNPDWSLAFQGTFNGNGKVIDGLTISNSTELAQGLFGAAAYVRNLTLTNVDITVTEDCVMPEDFNAIGSITGVSLGCISNCTAYGSINYLYQEQNWAKDVHSMVGGLVGFSAGQKVPVQGVVAACSSYVSLSSRVFYMGGISGYNDKESRIINCGNFGSINGLGVVIVGGIVGENDGEIINVFNQGDLSLSADDLGGVVGYNRAGFVQNVYSSGTLSGSFTTGGVIGCNSGGTLTNGYWRLLTAAEAVGRRKDSTQESQDSFTVAPSSVLIQSGGKLLYALNDYVAANSGQGLLWWTMTGSSSGYPVLTSVAPAKVSVAFAANGGTFVDGGSISNMVCYADDTYGERLALSNSLLRTGYTFKGWFTAASGGAVVGAASNVVAGTVYAQWIAKTYIATFTAAGGTPATTNIVQTYGHNTVLPSPVPVRVGYTLESWTNNAGGVVTASSMYETDSAQTFYAKWAANAFSVRYNKNNANATGTMADQAFTYDQSQALAANIFRSAGQRMIGWGTTVNGSVIYTDGAVVSNLTATANGVFNLYAQWVDDQIVYFDAQGGTTPVPASIVVTNDFAYGPLAVTTREGYTFGGWFTATNGQGVLIVSNTLASESHSRTLYAGWTANTYTTTFVHNNGTPGSDVTNQTYDARYHLPAVVPEAQTGFYFIGWWTALNGGTEVTASSTVKITADSTFYGQWTNLYTVVFDAQGGSVAPSNRVVNYGSLYGELPTPLRNGYGFDGWWTAPSHGGAQIHSDSLVSITATQTLYAAWTNLPVTVTFDPGTGTVDPAVATVFYDQPYGALPIPLRTGYTFTNWILNVDGAVTAVTNETVVALWTNHVLVAGWSNNVYTLTFDPDGGTVTPTSKRIVYDVLYGDLPRPRMTGFVSRGWTNSVGEVITAQTLVTVTNDFTVYPKWEVSYEVPVTLDPQGGFVTPSNITYETGVQITYSDLPDPVRDGFRFTGWYSSWTNHALMVTNGSEFLVWSNHTLYAKWVGTHPPAGDALNVVTNGDGTAALQYSTNHLNGVLMLDRVPNTPDGAPIVTIGASGFFQQAGLTDLQLGIFVTNVGTRAFAYCNALTNVFLQRPINYVTGSPDTLTIGNGAFMYCTSLRQVVFPDGLVRIGAQAFDGCLNLTRLYFEGSIANPATLIASANAFRGVAQANGGVLELYYRDSSVSNAFAAIHATLQAGGVNLRYTLLAMNDDVYDLATSGIATLPPAVTLGNRALMAALPMRKVDVRFAVQNTLGRSAEQVMATILDKKQVTVLYWTHLQGDPAVLTPIQVIDHEDGSATALVEVPAEVESGFFKVLITEK